MNSKSKNSKVVKVYIKILDLISRKQSLFLFEEPYWEITNPLIEFDNNDWEDLKKDVILWNNEEQEMLAHAVIGSYVNQKFVSDNDLILIIFTLLDDLTAYYLLDEIANGFSAEILSTIDVQLQNLFFKKLKNIRLLLDNPDLKTLPENSIYERWKNHAQKYFK